jgi:hypothetical protein
MSAAPRITRTSAMLALCACLISACVREGAAVVAPLEADVGDAGPVAALVIASPPPADDRCTARLRALPIETGPGCTLDERISRTPGTLYYPCTGAGPVEAVFGEHHFTGHAGGTALTLTLSTELDWEDHCHWETQQSISGTWKRGTPEPRDAGPKKPKPPTLIWSYSEAPVSGTNCLGSCIANAQIEIDDIPTRPPNLEH